MKAVASSLSKAWKWLTRPKRVEFFLACFALGMIGGGAWWIYPPAGPLSVGALLWLDLSFGGRK
jgi:hypothetical protein